MEFTTGLAKASAGGVKANPARARHYSHDQVVQGVTKSFLATRQ